MYLFQESFFNLPLCFEDIHHTPLDAHFDMICQVEIIQAGAAQYDSYTLLLQFFQVREHR